MNNLAHWALDLLFPPKCVFCRRLLYKGETHICSTCRLELPIFQGPGLHSTYITDFTAALYYEGTVRLSLHRFKFRGIGLYADAYALLLAAAVQAKLKGSFDWITWCPISKKRRRKRGYDQGELLARALGKRLELPVVATLHKTRDNPAQSAAGDAQARRANVLGVYAPNANTQLEGKRVLLIDDIATTGATLQEASRILLTAGAADVCCAVVASTRER